MKPTVIVIRGRGVSGNAKKAVDAAQARASRLR